MTPLKCVLFGVIGTCLLGICTSVNSISSITTGRRQLKTLLTIDERGSKIDRNSVFDCHLSPDWRQMAIENSVSNDFWSTFVASINVFDWRLPGVGIVGSSNSHHYDPGQNDGHNSDPGHTNGHPNDPGRSDGHNFDPGHSNEQPNDPGHSNGHQYQTRGGMLGYVVAKGCTYLSG